MTDPPEILKTARLRLRKPVLQDAAEIFLQYAQDPEVTKYLTWKPNRHVEETREFVRGCLKTWQTRQSFHWVIGEKETDQLLGMITARVDDHKWELGYVLARVNWGRGYMTEVVKKVVDWALHEGEIYRVWSVCDLDNLASARVMEKAGMLREGILRRWSIHPTLSDEPRDAYCYAITR